MDKAHEDRSDPYLALLTLRNTPSESLGLSPAQIMFNRRWHRHCCQVRRIRPPTMRWCNLNSARPRITTEGQRPPCLKVGDTVRTRWKSRDEWQKAKVIKALPHRSYELQMGDGSIRRRTKKHVRFSREPPVIVSDEGNDIITPPPQPQPTDAAARASGSGVEGAGSRSRRRQPSRRRRLRR